MSSSGEKTARDHRLLEALYPVCSHDLPNQVVALQGMLQLFRWDEAPHLTAQGQEYFERLCSIAGKTAVLAQFLKELVRLQRRQAYPERLALPHLVEEMRAEMKSIRPGQSWTWHCRFPAECADVDRRLLHQGFMHLLQAADGELGDTAYAVDLETTAQPGHVLCAVSVHGEGPTPAVPTASEVELIQRRLEATLAQEFLAAAGVDCRPAASLSARSKSYVLEIPSQPPHG